MGLAAISDRLAEMRVPALRARMSWVRFTTAMAVGAVATESLADEQPVDGVSTPAICFEWLLIEAFVRRLDRACRPDDDRTCSIPRSDPLTQVYQPTPRQVEWASDQAVTGNLTMRLPHAAMTPPMAASTRCQRRRALVIRVPGVADTSTWSICPPVCATALTCKTVHWPGLPSTTALWVCCVRYLICPFHRRPTQLRRLTIVPTVLVVHHGRRSIKPAIPGQATAKGPAGSAGGPRGRDMRSRNLAAWPTPVNKPQSGELASRLEAGVLSWPVPLNFSGGAGLLRYLRG